MQTVAELPLVGGDLALDFVNTAEQRGHPEAQDVLHAAADLRTWGRRTGILSASGARAGAADEFPRAIAARELLYELFVARIAGRDPSRAQLRALSALTAEAYGAASLVRAADGGVEWRWPRHELSSVRHTAVAGALELLRSAPSGRLKQCPGNHCGWLFIDVSKRGNRRWCSMNECGQEAKDEQRRARRRAHRQA